MAPVCARVVGAFIARAPSVSPHAIRVNDEATARYHSLGPDEVLGAVESLGYVTDGRLLALNSYENRVYQIGIEEQRPVIGKFYRPLRWSDETILEEHQFTLDLAARELPVVAPLTQDGESLFVHKGFRFAVYPSVGGRPPELEDPDHLEQLGRLLGRLHAAGASQAFRFRPSISIERYAIASRRYLHEEGYIPDFLVDAYLSVSDDLIERIGRAFERAGNFRYIRVHGDLHAGNILWSSTGPQLLDFDDAGMGPAIQDFWMVLGGGREAMTAAIGDLLEGYREFHDFDPRELHLIEALRSLRIMHYAAWLARRWPEPAFERAFPWFNTPRYWEEHVLSLREQCALVDEEPLYIGNY